MSQRDDNGQESGKIIIDNDKSTWYSCNMINRIDWIEEQKVLGKSYQDIATSMNLSKQRIQQLVSPPAFTKNALLRRAKGKCELCSLPTFHGDIHHKLQKNLHINHIDNLMYLCKRCHIHLHHPYSVKLPKRAIVYRCGHVLRASSYWCKKDLDRLKIDCLSRDCPNCH